MNGLKGKENDIIFNIVQSLAWQEKTLDYTQTENTLVLPLILSSDAYENNNPLGSHRGICKTNAVYLSIACLPPEKQAQLDNIFPFLLYNSLDIAEYGYDIVYAKVIEELLFLEKRHRHKCCWTNFKIYFSLILIIGDNLGLHELFGFAAGFKANYFCRFCSIHKKDINDILLEEKCILRDLESYKYDLKTKNL